MTLKIVVVTSKSIGFERLSLEKLRKDLTLSIFELEKVLSLKQIKSLPERDWYHYQCAKAAPMAMAIVGHQIKRHPYLHSVTSEPTVDGDGHVHFHLFYLGLV